MIGIVIAGHSSFPQGLFTTAKKIMGKLSKVAVIATRPEEEPFHPRNRLDNAIEKVASREGVVILTDILGGSVCSMATNMEKKYPIRVVTGINLPMLFALANYRENIRDVNTLATMMEKVGKRSITTW